MMDEKDLLTLLKEAIAAGRVSVALDFKRLAHMDSPICVEADSNRWIYGIMFSAIGAGLVVDWTAGVAVVALGVGLYFAIGRGWIERRMTARFHDLALGDIAAFKKLWRLNGVTLGLVSRAALCRSPGGDWRRFVLKHMVKDDAD
ncbi:MAG: hypothetical protein O7E53_00620 [Alphaproteobacteria bacterium]|nr:hypothetical protein [Alphaproteobacteria bacterium]